MQFVPYIKFCYSGFVRSNTLSLVSLVVTTLLVSGCSNMPDFKSISKNIIDLVNIPNEDANAYKNQIDKNTQQPILSTKNTYLDQEAHLMSGVSKDVIAFYQKALVLMEQKQWQAALSLFDQVIAKQPNLSGSYVNQAMILKKLSEQQSGSQRTEQLIKSELLIDTAIRINSLNPYALHFKGQLLQDKGLFEQAEQRYAAALSIWPSYAQAQLSMAVLLELYRGKLLDAYQYYSVYLLNKPEDQQVKRWQAALAIKINRAGLSLPIINGE